MANVRSLTAIANDRDFTKTHTAQYDTNQTGATVVTPTVGTSLAIKGIYVGTEEASTGKIRLYFSDDENDTTDTVYVAYAADENPGYVPLLIRGDRNAVLKMDSALGADEEFFVLVNYKEE